MKNKISKWDVGGGSRSIIQSLNLFTSRNLFKSLKSILMVVALLSLSSNVWGAWTKVTSAPTDWSGEYLLVYESSTTAGVAWTGVDAAKCNVAVTISSGSIADKPTGAVSLTIATMTGGYSIKVNGGTNNGKYIKGTSNSNALGFDNNAQLNTLSYDATNKGVLITSNTSVMRYNAGASDCRFRYYKSSSYSSQKIVQLYKAPSTFSVTYNGNNATSGSVPTDATAYSSGASVTVLGNTGNLVKTGKKFGGWNTNSSGTGTTYQAGGTFNISANTTLYAKWDDITYTDLSSGHKSGHFQPSFLAHSQIVIWGFFAFFCKKVFHIRCTKGAYRMHGESRPSSQPFFSPFGTLFAIAPTWLIPNWLIGYPI